MITMVCLLFALAGMAQKGVRFEELSFEKALEKAKAENKRVFVDCYTSWCGPCKRMVSSVFPQKEVGDYMNRHFVNVKYDMEKGEGPALKERYRVAVFPTFLIVNSDGTIHAKFTGYTNAQQYMTRLKGYVESDTTLGMLEKQYDAGQRGKELLTVYGELLRACSDPRANQVSSELFGLLSDEERFSERFRYIYQRVDYFPIGSPEWKFFVENQERFAQLLGGERVPQLLFSNYSFTLSSFLSGRTELTARKLKYMEKELKKLTIAEESKPILVALLQVAKAVEAGNIDRLIDVCEQELPKIPSGRIPRKMFELQKDKMTAEQQARWEALEKELYKK